MQSYINIKSIHLTLSQLISQQNVTMVLDDTNRLVGAKKNMLPCQFTHQNVEGAIYCSECHPNGPDFD
jgi:hypothetical protein